MVIYHGIFHVKPGMRDAYVKEILASGLIGEFEKQPGCRFYTVGVSLTNSDDLIVCDAWETEEDFKGHVGSGAVAAWHEIYRRYVPSCDEKEYYFPGNGDR